MTKSKTQLMLQEIKQFIENERDNGNIEVDYTGAGKLGFSASICLSNLLKYLETKEHES